MAPNRWLKPLNGSRKIAAVFDEGDNVDIKASLKSFSKRVLLKVSLNILRGKGASVAYLVDFIHDNMATES